MDEGVRVCVGEVLAAIWHHSQYPSRDMGRSVEDVVLGGEGGDGGDVDLGSKWQVTHSCLVALTHLFSPLILSPEDQEYHEEKKGDGDNDDEDENTREVVYELIEGPLGEDLLNWILSIQSTHINVRMGIISALTSLTLSSSHVPSDSILYPSLRFLSSSLKSESSLDVVSLLLNSLSIISDKFPSSNWEDGTFRFIYLFRSYIQ